MAEGKGSCSISYLCQKTSVHNFASTTAALWGASAFRMIFDTEFTASTAGQIMYG